MSITVTKELTFDCAHLLTNHHGLCKNIHGHTYKLQATFQRSNPEEPLIDQDGASDDSMVVDFHELKGIMKDVSDKFDHALILNFEDAKQEAIYHAIQAILPQQKFLLMTGRTTAENMSMYIQDSLVFGLQGSGIRVVNIKLWETPTSFAEVSNDTRY